MSKSSVHIVIESGAERLQQPPFTRLSGMPPLSVPVISDCYSVRPGAVLQGYVVLNAKSDKELTLSQRGLDIMLVGIEASHVGVMVGSGKRRHKVVESEVRRSALSGIMAFGDATYWYS